MAVHFPPDLITTIKASNDIIEIINEYTTLRKEGGLYVSKCPFPHGGTEDNPLYEDTGSLTVYPDSQSFFCYGCGKGDKQNGNAGSDVIAFIQEIEKVSWPEAVKLLAQRVSLPLPSEKIDPEVQRLKAEVTNKNRVYWNNLINNQNALDYLSNRAFPMTKEMIDKYRLGLVPGDDPVISVRDRISIAIMEMAFESSKAATIAFGYRTLKDEKPKYKNDATNKIYEKNKTLYLLSHAFKEIRRKRYAIVVEGYFDAIAMHESGMSNTVATCGTSFTEEQMKELRKYTDKVFLWFDGDETGVFASFRHLPKLLELGFTVLIVSSPGKDPDEICAKVGKEGIVTYLMSHSKPAVQMVIEKHVSAFDAIVNQEKLRVLNNVLPIINTIQKLNERAIYYSDLSKKLNLNIDILR